MKFNDKSQRAIHHHKRNRNLSSSKIIPIILVHNSLLFSNTSSQDSKESKFESFQQQCDDNSNNPGTKRDQLLSRRIIWICISKHTDTPPINPTDTALGNPRPRQCGKQTQRGEGVKPARNKSGETSKSVSTRGLSKWFERN